MKKTLAICLSLMLVVAAVFALALGTNAAEVKASSVTLIDSTGGTHVLDAVTTTYNAGSGTATFDAATGTLTLNNATGLKRITSPNGALTIVAKGESTIVSDGTHVLYANKTDASVPSNLTIKGDGTLNVKATGFAIFSETGSITVTGDVVLNVESNADTIHLNGGGKDVIFGGNAVVNSLSHSTGGIRHVGSGKVYVQENAVVTSVMEATANWAAAMTARQFVMTGGTLNLKTVGLDAPTPTTLNGLAVNGPVNITGGTINIEVDGVSQLADRVHAIYLDVGNSMMIKNATLNLKVNTPKTGNGEAGVITTEETYWITTHKATINVDAPNTTALFVPRNIDIDDGDANTKAATFDINLYETTITGVAKSFVETSDLYTATNPGVEAININVDKDCTLSFGASAGVLGAKCEKMVKATNEASMVQSSDFKADSYGLYTGDPSIALLNVTVTPSIGADFVLNAGKPTLTAAEAAFMNVSTDSIVYDAGKGVVTFNNMNGEVNRVYVSGGNAKIVVKGENTITGLPGVANILGGNGEIEITGDGSLTVSGGNYTVCNPGKLVLSGDLKLKVISHSDNAIHVSRTAAPGDCALIVKDNVKLDIVAKTRGIYNPGARPIVKITDNADVSISSLQGTSTQGVFLYADVDDGTGNQTALFEVSGNASFKTAPTIAQGVYVTYRGVAEDAPTALKEETVFNAVFTASGNAKVDISGFQQGIILGANRKGSIAKLNIVDAANVNVDNTDTTERFATGAAVWVSGDMNYVNMTTTGTVNMTSNAGGWRGSFFLSGNDYDILIKDTILNVTNISESKSASNPEVINAINPSCSGENGKFVIAGKAVVTAYAERNGENATNRAHGLFLHPKHVLTIQDDAVLNSTASGDSKANTGAAIHLKGASILVKDNGKMNLAIKENAIAGITFEAESALTVEGNGKVVIDASAEEKMVAVRSYTRTTKGVIEVKEGTGSIEMFGDPAVSTAQRKLTIKSAVMKTGESKKKAETVEKITGKEAYVLLAAKNPPTSDYTVAAFAIVGLIAVATTAAVILRKKHND